MVGGEALVKGAFPAPWSQEGYMIGWLELFTFCLVIIGVIGLTIRIIEFFMKRK